ADPNHGARAPRIDFADVDDLLVVRRPIDDPAAGRRDGRDPGAGPRFRLGLVAGRRSGNPDSALAGVGQMALAAAAGGGRAGGAPWSAGDCARRGGSLAALGAPEPPADLAALVRFAVGTGDRVVRLQLTDGHPEIATRDVSAEQAVHVVVASEVHKPYPHKTTRREQFGRALADARRVGAHDAVLVSAEG